MKVRVWLTRHVNDISLHSPNIKISWRLDRRAGLKGIVAELSWYLYSVDLERSLAATTDKFIRVSPLEEYDTFNNLGDLRRLAHFPNLYLLLWDVSVSVDRDIDLPQN